MTSTYPFLRSGIEWVSFMGVYVILFFNGVKSKKAFSQCEIEEVKKITDYNQNINLMSIVFSSISIVFLSIIMMVYLNITPHWGVSEMFDKLNNDGFLFYWLFIGIFFISILLSITTIFEGRKTAKECIDSADFTYSPITETSTSEQIRTFNSKMIKSQNDIDEYLKLYTECNILFGLMIAVIILLCFAIIYKMKIVKFFKRLIQH